MKYVCTGLVHPERANVQFERCELKSKDWSVTITCDASQITVVLDIPPDNGRIPAFIAHDIAGNVANMVVGALGFSLGLGYSIEITQVIEPDGTPHVFGVSPSGRESGQTLQIEPYIPAFNRALHLSGRDIYFRLALQDYLRAINDVRDCPTYCYRAIEAIKSAFQGKAESDQWNAMHAALGTDRNTIENKVKQYADPTRHGNWMNEKLPTAKQRWEMLSLARDILVKYMEYAEPPSQQ